jgi:hypothetical protein
MTINTNINGYALQFSCKFMRSIPYGEIKIINGIISEVNIPNKVLRTIQANHQRRYLDIPPLFQENKRADIKNNDPDIPTLFQASNFKRADIKIKYDPDIPTYWDTNAENDQNIIPDLVQICEDNFNNSDIVKWVSRNGFLTAEKNANQESIEAFKTEARMVADLWRKLAEVRCADIDSMKTWIEFRPVSLGEDLLVATYKTETSFMSNKELSAPFKEKYESNPSLYLQRAGFRYIIDQVLPRIEGVVLDEIGVNDVKFTLQPHLRPDSLLQYLYLKILIVLCDPSKRTCLECGRLFKPNTNHQKFCPDPDDGISLCKNKYKNKNRSKKLKTAREEAKRARIQDEVIKKNKSKKE